MGNLKTLRNQVELKGALQFAPVNCHRNLKLRLKDDVKSWHCLLLDLKESRLPKTREPSFYGIQCKHQFSQKLGYTSNLNYPDKVDYKFLYANYKQGPRICEVRLEDPYDWKDEQKQSSVSKDQRNRRAQFQQSRSFCRQ
ncbi:hypothetical protein M3Y98_00572800 [Aphelenchoides besseyi]|nr:hypothetical protein M3Y98_00572800 [Aphelenchoides besseyi]KAI6193734.1 hypothetical protein M3Y96_01050300 [Aphelenchoides besseyi]